MKVTQKESALLEKAKRRMERRRHYLPKTRERLMSFISLPRKVLRAKCSWCGNQRFALKTLIALTSYSFVCAWRSPRPRLKGAFFLHVFNAKDAFSLSHWLQFRTSLASSTPQGQKSHFPAARTQSKVCSALRN
jgi:hypothetical protein